MRTQKVPMRLCAGCRQMKPKSELLRVVLTEDGAQYDRTGKVNGRGVYVCRDRKCIALLQKARRSKLAGSGSIPDSVFEVLQEAADGE